MKVQSAGRLGNNLFIWAFAVNFSRINKSKVSIFTDKYHSGLGSDSKETANLLSDSSINFKNSNLCGMSLVITDWLTSHSKTIGFLVKRIIGVKEEHEKISPNTRLARGYFQNPHYVEENNDYIKSKLEKSIARIYTKSEKVREFKKKYPVYQLIHVRLGDYVNSNFGTILPISYKKLIIPDIPIVICSDGSRNQVEKFLDFRSDLIITPNEMGAWETLCVMQGAERFIGANSTLSWWGAYLVTNSNKVAYLPNCWKIDESSEPSGPNLLEKFGTFTPVFGKL